ncbi:unnamed protein product [Cylicocyclus nassatus]|uniref:Uncharacterized protein n=1 Tax=Cylicocyclus nassatus TaxID=53992 RepID=A0AA36DMI0_CYLNA|nr:unnamed protein product [Cylicocyclus nassatus]
MFAKEGNNAAARQASWETELMARELAREAVRNVYSPRSRMVRDLQRMHELVPTALEMHRTKVRALHPEEEEKMLYHFL